MLSTRTASSCSAVGSAVHAQDVDVELSVVDPGRFYAIDEANGRAELIIGKQRNGPIGTVNLFFHKQYTRFENLANESYAGSFE